IIMAEITLWPKATAEQIIFDKIVEIAGMKANLFKNALTDCVARMYRDGYVLGHADTDSFLRLQKSGALTVKVGPVEIFLPGYGRKFLFAQAERSKLPIALIQKELEALIEDLYESGYVFGKAVDETAYAKLRDVSEKNLTVKLVMKPLVETGEDKNVPEACSVYSAGGVSGDGSGTESGDSAGVAVCASSSGDQSGDDQRLPAGGDGPTGANDGASGHAAAV
ncbi:MAG: hypothetical protein ACRERV_18345, partial [Methylococcales bacterium]